MGEVLKKWTPTYDLGLYTTFKKWIQEFHRGTHSTMMDLGSGDGAIHAVNFILHEQVKKFYLVDEFIFPEIIFSKVDSYLESSQEKARVKESLRCITSSHNSFAGIPDGSIDIVMSTSLFEHVLTADVPVLIAEIYKKLSDQGTAIFSIDLRDHYDFTELFSFYRYPEWLWKLMTYDRGRYMNRLRSSDFIRVAQECGFTIVHTYTEKSGALFPPKLAAPFRKYSEGDLRTVHVVLMLQKSRVS